MSAPWVKNTLMASGVAIAWFFGWMIAIAALRPEYSHATKAVSELGALGAPYMLAWNVLGFLGTGLALTGFAWAYRKLLREEAVGFQALAASGVLFCLTAIPITMGSDGDPDYASRWTQAHLAAVLLSPLPWLYAVSRIAVSFRRGKLSTLSVVSAVAIGGVLLATAARLAQLLPHAPGLLQRVSFVPYLGWYTAAWLLLRRSAPFLATDEGRHENDSSPS